MMGESGQIRPISTVKNDVQTGRISKYQFGPHLQLHVPYRSLSLSAPYTITMASSAGVFLRRLAFPAASKSAQQQLRSASAIAARSTLATFSSSQSAHSNAIVSARRGMATISAGDALARLASEHPHQEIVRYEHKNVKWTLQHVNYYSDALACGFLDAGLMPGDVVLSWLPAHFAEQVRVEEVLTNSNFLKKWHMSLWIIPISKSLLQVILSFGECLA